MKKHKAQPAPGENAPAGRQRTDEERAALLEEMQKALEKRRYDDFYRLLREYGGTLAYNDAVFLFLCTINLKVPPGVFTALLDACPPVSEINDLVPFRRYCIDNSHRPLGMLCRQKYPASSSLVHQAITADEPRLLKILLEYGADPNLRPENVPSPLELAVDLVVPRCITVLLECPALNLTLFPELLPFWACEASGRPDRQIKRALCGIADRLPAELFYPRRPSGLPIPRALEFEHAIDACNPWLFCCLYSQGVLPDEGQARRMLESLPAFLPVPPEEYVLVDTPAGCGTGSRKDALQAMLLSLRLYPALLDEPMARGHLAESYLALPPRGRRDLSPWMKRLRGGTVPLVEMPLGWDSPRSVLRILRRWQALPPGGPALCVDANDELIPPGGLDLSGSAGGRPSLVPVDADPAVCRELLELSLAQCVILREKQGDNPVSRLARMLLRYGTPEMTAAQLRPGGLLAGEDPAALLAYCAKEGAARPPKENHTAVITALRIEKSYDL